MKHKLLILFVILSSAPAAAEEVAAPEVHPALLEGEGGSAAQSFARGEYAEAARRYEVLLETRGASAALLYDVGTSWAMAERPGRAIWALERARLLAPADEEIAHNLEVTRQRVRVERVRGARGQGLTEGEPDGIFWFRLLSAWRASWWAWAGAALHALGWALLALRRRRAVGGARDALSVGAAAALLCGVALIGAVVARSVVMGQVRPGVVLQENPRLAPSPLATAARQRHADLYEGAVVRVLERRGDGWVRVRLVDGAEGWLSAAEVGEVTP